MSTRNIVPRADGEGSIGTSAKKWGAVNTNSVITNAINGNNPETLLHPRKNTTAYEAGDVAFAVSAPSSIALVCVTAGTTAITEPDFSGVAISDIVTDGTAEWRCQPIVGGDGVPLGMVAPFLQTSIPDGWLSCENGQVVLRSAYPELWTWVQANAPLVTEAQWQTKAASQTSVGYYSDGDGSTTFRLPRLVGFMEGTTAANVGAFTAAGLPNINGEFGWGFSSGDDWTGGTFRKSYISTDGLTTKSEDFNSNCTHYDFDASRSSAIYGASNTVQPESVGMVWCVRAFGAAVNQGTVDITELAQMLNLKQDKATVRNDAGGLIDLVNVNSYTGYAKFGTTNGKNLIIQWGISTITSGNYSSFAFPISFTGADTFRTAIVASANSALSVSAYDATANSVSFISSAPTSCSVICVGY